MVVSASGPFGIKPGSFFNMKGLSAEAIARLEQTVKTSRDTLALADRLQTARDVAKALHKLELSLKVTTSLSGRFLDLYS